MKKIILFIAFMFTVSLLYAQTNSLPPLKKERMNADQLSDQYWNEPNGPQYINYKIFTTVPIKTESRIPREYYLRDFTWDYIYKNQSDETSTFHRLLFERMRVRQPSQGEDEKSLYFESTLPADSVTQFWCDCCQENTTIGVYLSLNDSTENLLKFSIPFLFYDVSVNLESSLKDSGGKLIPFRNATYRIIPGNDKKTISFVIGLSLDTMFSTDCYHGDVAMRVEKIAARRHEVITKESIGNKIRVGGELYTVLEYKNGLVHLEGVESDNISRATLLFGQKGEVFRKYDSFRTIPYALYNEYRKNPNLTYEQFIENSARFENLPESGLTIFMLNHGYNADALYVVDEMGFENVNYSYRVSLSMKDAVLSIFK